MAELDTNVTPEAVQDVENKEQEAASETQAESTELARIRAEMAKLKAANDKLSKENSEKTKALRAKQSAEEVAAEEAKAQQEALMQELETLRREKSVAATTAKILPMVGDGEIAGQISEYLYGAEDVDAALTALQKAWSAKEKALRLEFGKIPAPGAGGSDGPTITREQLDGMKFPERVKFMNEHRDEYEKLMGR